MSHRGTIVPTTVLPWLQSGKHGGPRSLYADTGLDCRLASTRLAAVEMHSRMPADGWRRRGPDRNQVNRKGQWPDRPGRRPPTNGSGRVATTGPSSAQSAQSAPHRHAFRQVSAHLTGVKREPLLNCVRVAASERARRALCGLQRSQRRKSDREIFRSRSNHRWIAQPTRHAWTPAKATVSPRGRLESRTRFCVAAFSVRHATSARSIRQSTGSACASKNNSPAVISVILLHRSR